MEAQRRLLFCWLCIQGTFTSIFCNKWTADVVPQMDALVTSCVVIPCTFTYDDVELPASRLRPIWHFKKDSNEIIYHYDPTKISDNFKGRTELVGHLGDRNCSLKIDRISDHDNGPFCFRIELTGSTKEKYSFVESCVDFHMEQKPQKPNLRYDEYFKEGEPSTFICLVEHTCPSHPPTLTWSRRNDQARVHHRTTRRGVWETESVLTFITTSEDDHTELTCTASFHGGSTNVVNTRLYVKAKANYLHIIIPVAAVFGTILLFGVVCLFVTKKYKRQIQELQARNDNGMWSRLSRMSRRRDQRHDVDMHLGNKSNNHVSKVSGTGEFSKPRCPSPKSERKDYGKSGYDYDTHHGNITDSNIYGNV